VRPFGEVTTCGSRTAVLAAMLAMAPLGAEAADLVICWEKGFYPQEGEAVGDVIAAFEQGTGKEVELAFYCVTRWHGE
jgi:hypothetical protein